MDTIVIIGGGIIGTSLAYSLRDAPVNVVLLEKGSLGSGTTSKSIAVFSWLNSDPSPVDHELKERSWSRYSPHIEDGTFTFKKIGAMIVAQTSEYYSKLETAADTLREYGINVELLSPTEMSEFGIESSETEGALYTPEEGYLDPHEIVQHWTDEVITAGERVQTDTEVTDIRTEDGAVSAVETTSDVIQADDVINAAGPWAPRINEMVGVSLPLRHTYGRILVLQQEDEFLLPYTLFESGAYFRSEGRNQAFAGHLEKDYNSASVMNPDEAHSVEESFYREVAENTSTLIPQLSGADIVSDWVGLRTVTPDKRPIVDSTDIDGFLVACGMSGLGVTYAPIIGDLLSDYIIREEKSSLLQELSFERFA